MEATRSETFASVPSMSACCGTVVTGPSQEPARVFILSKDFCASDWAKAVAAIRTNRRESAMRDFMFSVLLILLRCIGGNHLDVCHFVRCRSKCAWIGLSFIMNVQSSV